MLPKTFGTFNIIGAQLKSELAGINTMMYQNIELAPAFLIHFEGFLTLLQDRLF